MSVRFFKIFAGVFVAHLVLLSLVWVGFSAPLPRLPVTFIYQGALPAEDVGEEQTVQQDNTSDHLVFDHLKAAYFNRWITLRDPAKPFY